MTKKGSALMQVMVVGLIVAAFSVLMLRYAVTRSSNLSRTERILESQIIADSCLDQYMAYLAEAELSGRNECNFELFSCQVYDNGGAPIFIPVSTAISSDFDMRAVRFQINPAQLLH